jgi:mannose-6-phosphate isomerase-like protein (cupin superfamily)
MDMKEIVRVDPSRQSFDIHPDLSVSARQRKPGPPERMTGMTVGIVSMDGDAPHGGEVHPDGDEVLCVLTGRLQIVGDSAPDDPIELGPGEACIIPKGEWHQVHVLEAAHFIHITPGPNGDHRPRS